MKIHPISNINTKGLPIADIKVKGTDNSYKLFSVNSSDSDFLKKMYEKINLKKLLPNLSDYDYTIWDEILRCAVNKSSSIYSKTVLDVCNDKPCGILNYKEHGKNYHIDYVATFPTEPEKRVPCAGQILFYKLFRQFLDEGKNKINLCALRNSNFSPVTIYRKLGFFSNGGDNYNEYMSITPTRAAQTLQKQNEFISYMPLKNTEEVDLEKVLSLDFKI